MATIKIIGLINGQPTEFDGKYLVEYDPTPTEDERGEFVHLVVTDDRAEALQFPSTAEAYECWRAVSKKGPRADGMPDRPLTAYCVEIY